MFKPDEKDFKTPSFPKTPRQLSQRHLILNLSTNPSQEPLQLNLTPPIALNPSHTLILLTRVNSPCATHRSSQAPLFLLLFNRNKTKTGARSVIRMKNYRNLYFNRRNNFHNVFPFFSLAPSDVVLFSFRHMPLVCRQGKKKWKARNRKRKLICLWSDKSSVNIIWVPGGGNVAKKQR